MGDGDQVASVDQLLDRAVAAINRGDQATAATLAGQVLAVDRGNPEAEDLLTPPPSGGEIRRLTILFVDLVDSTVMSTTLEPETCRTIVGRYHDLVHAVVERYAGHICSTKGDGLLAVFGHPEAHEDDAHRAVLAALEINREVTRLSEQAKRRFGVGIAARVGVHRGLVYLDIERDDIFGMAANVAQRVSTLAPSGAVVVSDAVVPLLGEVFELQERPPVSVKGVATPIAHHLVLGERADAARVGAGRGPLVGRERELTRLENSWRRAQEGTLRLPGVVFRGEPGIGKSRLAAAAVERVEASGAVVLELIGSPLHTDAGLYPVRTLLERRCGIDRTAGPAERLRLVRAEAAAQGLNPLRMVSLLAPVLGIPADAGYAPVRAEGRRLYDLITTAVEEYLLACFGRGAGLVIAEDVQWFDPSTLEVLGRLLEAGEGRLLVVITGQEGTWLPPGWPVKVFDLEPLTDEEIDTLITALNPRLSPQDRAAVRDRGDGIPFYIEQILQSVGDQRGRTEVPDALYEPLLARLHASANAVPVVEAAAVIGRRFDRGLLCAICTQSRDEIDDVLDQLEDALVIEPTGTDSWRFRGNLLHEVACELAPASVRKMLHSKAADALVRGSVGGDPDWRLVAGHYEQGERFDDAISAYRQASAAARRRGALAEARTYLTLAIAQLEHIAPGPGRDRREIGLRLERGLLAAAIEGNQNPTAVDDLERCLQLGGTDLHDDELVATMVALMVYYFTRADLNRVVRVLESLRTGFKQGKQWLGPVIEASFGVLEWFRGEFDASAVHLGHGTPELLSTTQLEIMWYQPNDPITTARLHLAMARFVHGDMKGAEEQLAQEARRLGELGFPQGRFSAAFADFVEIWMRIEAGQLHRAGVLAADLIDQAEQHGFDAWRLWGHVQLAAVNAAAAMDGHDTAELSAHIAGMTKLVDVLGRAGLNAYLTFFDGVLGRLLTAAGQLDRARDRFGTALARAEESGMHFYDAELLRLRAATHASPAAGQEDVSAALELARRQGATLFELRAALDDFDRRGEPARASVLGAVSRFPADSLCPEVRRAEAIVHCVE
ncbi:adenylate/guanylate cyclase family protein [Mycolicibacterium chubuense NBB4]|uniref:Adenylate/guanylate cyclase family protein n=1 Tax=Mycolicibacterium chubuense (strain NBB4) TaxID=710421 RepID=I4BK90_MYCCN|nr:adenylate/guanylate cyclase domain-containing protein [Mycolicibacterium chubuense]AFM17697.1 adenylate/guanylate cyclase family protein [Mycolicibacterium chubuense NBB4]